MELIRKTWNTYKRHDGYIMGWERSEELGTGHSVRMLDQEKNTITFQWRSSSEPVAGQRMSVVMVEDGVSVRPDRPVMILNHDTGEVIREQNAPPPRGTRPIMMALSVWVLIATSVACLLIAYTEGRTMVIYTLMATAFIVWRLAIATSELRYDEKAQKRIQDEEKLCLEIMTGAWRLATGEAINMDNKDKNEISHR
jgi:hypothetical protein